LACDDVPAGGAPDSATFTFSFAVVVYVVRSARLSENGVNHKLTFERL